MNAEDRTRIAAGENDELPPAPRAQEASEAESVRKDTAYSPASETETAQKQTEGSPAAANDPDIDEDYVKVGPGTGEIGRAHV